ncbi:plasmid mobilization protein [Azohydromonas australica]|uniref:plasmid mobilization protein n=1 Tax=Azohydromonas australica TaxID=364039 RepID=UPI0012EBEF21|nr:plasmid mobilization relaxosome protein MobC [Azohydromonas australica]
MPSPRQFLVVDVGPLKPLIVDCAARAHMPPGTWVRELLAQAVEVIGDTPAPERPSLKRPPRSGNPVKFFARLTPEESATLKAAAKAAGLSQSEYVARLVMNPAAAGAVGVPALQVLVESNRQLLAVGRNLNQIARSLNERLEKVTRAEQAQILQTVEMVRTHVELVASVIKELSVNRRTASRAKT